MIFRIVYIGNTHRLDEMLESAKEINSTARKTHLGALARCADDCIEATVESVEEGKALMSHIYHKIDCFPKYYAYVDGKSFWSPDFKRYLGTEVHSDNVEHVDRVTEEHFEDFLEK